MEFIDSQKIAFPELADTYESLYNLYTRKLWHQLTLELELFLSNPLNKRGNSFVELYRHFITKFEERLNQVSLALLATNISNSIEDTMSSLEFLNAMLIARTRLGAEASTCLDMDVVLIKLRLNQHADAKDLLESTKANLTNIKSTETVVFSKYYWANSEYHKCAGTPHEFYTSSLMFLAYTPVDSLPVEKKFVLATDMALAAITSENLYNFGEVIATPILSVLLNTPNQWIHDLIYALNSGDIDSFNMLVDSHRVSYYAQPALVTRHETIKKKVVLMCLLNIAFERPSHDRQISFADIAMRARIPLNQVEWVVMRAMSLGLVRGTMNEVSQIVSITWVQPRVLHKDQLGLLCQQLEGWTERVKTALVSMEDQTPELFV